MTISAFVQGDHTPKVMRAGHIRADMRWYATLREIDPVLQVPRVYRDTAELEITFEKLSEVE